MDVTYQKKNGETIQLLTEASMADSLFPVGFSFVSATNETPSFGKWSIDVIQICVYVNFTNTTGSIDMYIIRRTE